MTTIQKFEDALESSNGQYDVLNPSEDVIVMVRRGPPHSVRYSWRAYVPGPAQTPSSLVLPARR